MRKAFDFPGDEGKFLVKDTACDPPYFWVVLAPEMTDEAVEASVATGALIPCPLGPQSLSDAAAPPQTRPLRARPKAASE